MQIKVVRQILEWNEDCHKEVQEELGNKNVKMINIMGSPGAGKTTFILNLIEELIPGCTCLITIGHALPSHMVITPVAPFPRYPHSTFVSCILFLLPFF